MNVKYKDELIADAKLGMEDSYCVVTDFPVGADVLTAKRERPALYLVFRYKVVAHRRARSTLTLAFRVMEDS